MTCSYCFQVLVLKAVIFSVGHLAITVQGPGPVWNQSPFYQESVADSSFKILYTSVHFLSLTLLAYMDICVFSITGLVYTSGRQKLPFPVWDLGQ